MLKEIRVNGEGIITSINHYETKDLKEYLYITVLVTDGTNSNIIGFKTDNSIYSIEEILNNIKIDDLRELKFPIVELNGVYNGKFVHYDTLKINKLVLKKVLYVR